MSITIPRFQSRWSDQMICFLADKSDDFIMDNLLGICESWGAFTKVDRPKYVVKTMLKDAAKAKLALEIIESWGASQFCR